MSQSEWIGAILIAGFLVWLAMNKRLSVYWSILTGGAAAAGTPAQAPQGGGGIGGGYVTPQGGANMPLPVPVPPAQPKTPSTQGVPANPFPFSFKNTPLCWLGGAWCN